MESPPSFSTHSEVPPISEDSGLLVTSGSFSSDSASGWQYITSEFQESDYDERSLSPCEPADAGRTHDNFNTVKKGPGKAALPTIDPPPEFQDSPAAAAAAAAAQISRDDAGGRRLKPEPAYERRTCLGHRYASPRLLRHSPGRRPLAARLSSSHNSLVNLVPDDSNFITQAISHDALGRADIPDMYTVPFDSDIYAVPVDMVRPAAARARGKKAPRVRRRRSASHAGAAGARRGADADADSLHATLREMRRYLHTLYASPGEATAKVEPIAPRPHDFDRPKEDARPEANNNVNRKPTKSLVVKTTKKKDGKGDDKKPPKKASPVRILSLNLKKSFCNLFRWRRAGGEEAAAAAAARAAGEGSRAVVRRALPPLPPSPPPARRAAAAAAAAAVADAKEAVSDFATSIQKVKDHGWYWGPISVEAAEKILSSEPDGSFIVRDSSDDHYIFTLTFKLNGLRHVRIEHDQGSFCFGGCTMFKAQTIVEFIENAVETSRSGRYLFFLNLRPVLGPVRVQLLYPVSRFKRVQSLQHMCRFVILKLVRRDLVGSLPLPRRLVDYLNAAQYYSELLAEA